LLGLVFADVACGPVRVTQEYAEISVSPSTLDFGTVLDLETIAKPLMVTNTGNAVLNIHSVTVTGDPDSVFNVPSVPTQLAIGASTMMSVVMKPPATTVPYTASLVIDSDAANSHQFLVQLFVTVSPVALADGGPPDAGSEDAGELDAGTSDAGSGDAGEPDAGPLDSGPPPVDAGPADSGTPDAGPKDSGPEAVDAGPADSGPADAGPPDAGNGCPWNQIMCGTECVDPRSNPQNCGTCGNYCSSFNTPSDAGIGCSNGVCVACNPTAGYTIVATGQGQPIDLAVDSESVYWPAQTTPAVVKASLTGATLTTLVSDAQFPTIPGFQPTRLTVDTHNVYFSANYSPIGVYEVGLNGGATTSVGGTNIAAWPGKVAVNSSAVYWVSFTTGDLWRAPLNDPAGAAIIEPGPAAGGMDGWDLAGLDDTYVYWYWEGTSPSGRDSFMERAPLAGGTPSTVVSDIALTMSATVDSSNLYYTEYIGTVVKVATEGGGMPVTIASGLAGPRRIVVDETNAYWTAGGTDNTASMTCDSVVQTVGLNGGPVTDLATGQYSAYAIAVDSNYVYFADIGLGTVLKTPK
jgi:hypothetical protein